MSADNKQNNIEIIVIKYTSLKQIPAKPIKRRYIPLSEYIIDLPNKYICSNERLKIPVYNIIESP